MRKLQKLIQSASLILFSTFFLLGCSKNNCDFELNQKLDLKPITITRLEMPIFESKNTDAIKQTLDKYNPIFERYIHRSQYPHDSMLVNDLYNLTTDKKVDSLYQDVVKVFPDLENIESDMANAFAHINHYFPKFKTPAIFTIVSGFNQDMFIDDSIVVISLEYFLGEKSKYQPVVTYPNGYRMPMPQYMMRQFKPETITPSLVKLLSEQFVNSDLLDNSMLAEMINWGKVYLFAKHMMPCIPDSVLFGYSTSEANFMKNNEAYIYRFYVKENLLFETDHLVKRKYVEDRPKTPEINNECPGRTGQYIGYQILNAYLKKNNLDLQTVLNETDYQAIHQKSKYKP